MQTCCADQLHRRAQLTAACQSASKAIHCQALSSSQHLLTTIHCLKHTCTFHEPVCSLQRLEGQGELVEQHSHPFTHVLARQQYGVTKGSIAAVVVAGKIPLLLTDVEGAQKAKAAGLDCLSIFLAPASPQVDQWSTGPATMPIVLSCRHLSISVSDKQHAQW